MSWWLVTFSRGGSARYLSHLDTARVVQRTFARAGVPVSLSQGMRPKPRISLPLPLPVGAAGLQELAVVEVPDEVRMTAEALRALRDASPPGIDVERLDAAGERHPRPQPRTAEYACVVAGDAGAMQAAVERYGNEDHAICERVSPKGKRRLDLKEYVSDITVDPVTDGARLGFTIAYRVDGAARPQEFVDLIARWAEVEPAMCGLERRRIVWDEMPPAHGAGDGRSVSS